MNQKVMSGIWMAAFVICVLASCAAQDAEAAAVFQEKAAALREEALADWVRLELGTSPAGEAGNVVFFSVCGGGERARVFTGTGGTVDAAWDAACKKAEAAVRKGLQPLWVKADVVYLSQTVTASELGSALRDVRQGFFRYGAALDAGFDTALLEAELNGAGVYDYDEGGVSLEALNLLLEETGRKKRNALPEEYTVFQCAGWLCDESGAVWELGASGPSAGRRKVDLLDGEYAKDLILRASGYLTEQVREDGSFVYRLDPRFGTEDGGYNILRHAGTVWSMVLSWRIEADPALEEAIDRAVEYLLSQVVYDGEGRAYVYEAASDEIKLGGCGISVLALTEYMDAFQTEKYLDVCKALGEGILSLLDQETGEYYRVLNADFSPKEAFRTVYYDGEATYALCRLYGLTGEAAWLAAARSAADHFIRADYTQYKDHWVSYAMNELTKYVTDNASYYAFALENVQVNLKTIVSREITNPVNLELLMAAFELYDRLASGGASVGGFDAEVFLEAVRARAERQLDGFFYPETAMYMAHPQRVLNAFMAREDGFRLRIDDVQHNIGGYYLYWANYDKLLACGMPAN